MPERDVRRSIALVTPFAFYQYFIAKQPGPPEIGGDEDVFQ